MKNVLIYENKRVDDLYPFSINHCSWEIRSGALRLFEKVQANKPHSQLFFKGRDKWLSSFLKRFNLSNDSLPNNDILFISGNIILSKEDWEILEELREKKENFLIRNNSEIVGAYLNTLQSEILEHINQIEFLDFINELFSDIEIIDFPAIHQINYLWDSIFLNGIQINEDTHLLHHLTNFFTADYRGVFTIKPSNIFIGRDIDIAPSVVLDASQGNIIISNNAKIMPQSTIIGPCFVGEHSTIKIGAKIYSDCSIGEWCKIGGELENSIIHSYSNKQHDGFLGHSYIGEWVNFGADTNNSDLKNTYSEITMRLPNKDVNTGSIFLGLMCGDHTKTGINSMFTTGTVAGTCGILVKEWFMPNYIDSFSWGGKQNSPIYKFDKAIETARIVMKRRNKNLLDEEIELLRIEYERVKASRI